MRNSSPAVIFDALGGGIFFQSNSPGQIAVACFGRTNSAAAPTTLFLHQSPWPRGSSQVSILKFTSSALLMPPASLDAWQAYHRGLSHMFRFTDGNNHEAQQFFTRAIALDPTSHEAMRACRSRIFKTLSSSKRSSVNGKSP
jgi:hypothetical protein